MQSSVKPATARQCSQHEQRFNMGDEGACSSTVRGLWRPSSPPKGSGAEWRILVVAGSLPVPLRILGTSASCLSRTCCAVPARSERPLAARRARCRTHCASASGYPGRAEWLKTAPRRFARVGRRLDHDVGPALRPRRASPQARHLWCKPTTSVDEDRASSSSQVLADRVCVDLSARAAR